MENPDTQALVLNPRYAIKITEKTWQRRKEGHYFEKETRLAPARPGNPGTDRFLFHFRKVRRGRVMGQPDL
jgi:hypothetical protein